MLSSFPTQGSVLPGQIGLHPIEVVTIIFPKQQYEGCHNDPMLKALKTSCFV